MSGQQRICVQKILSHEQHIFDAIHSRETSSLHTQKLAAAFYTSKVWKPGTEITVGFIGDVDPPRTPTSELLARIKDPSRLDPLQKKLENTPIKEAIKTIVKERIEPYANLTFKFVDKGETAMVRIAFNQSDGAWSYLGKDILGYKSGATMNLGWFDVPTTIHEFGHVLGMVHEHQNPLGGILWDKSKVYDWAKNTQGWDKDTTYNNIIKKYNHDSINGSDFDPCSIMLYFFPADLTTSHEARAQIRGIKSTLPRV